MTDPFLAALEQATRTVVARVRGTVPAPTPTAATPPGVAISHRYCCDPDRALCGTDLDGLPQAGEGEQGCVVCVDLDEGKVACPLCDADERAS
ncbi:hypothetical protein ACQEVS_10090 [Streptomyces sp. CA-181903]|uniref:hypothetical protein n=1 Tax=Streptomyces sp. CA-181903 TaxID=3240055 RepID=UPI003D8F3197